MESRDRFVVHRVSHDEFLDLVLVSRLHEQSRSETLRKLIAEEKERLAEERSADRGRAA